MTTEKQLDEMVTLVAHNVRFPMQTVPNKPEFFGLSPIDFPKKAVSLGKLKLFPDEVWDACFSSYKESPMAKLMLIRSRLQYFIETNTFQFAHGLANALPDSKLIEFQSIVEEMENEFENAKYEYLQHYDNLKIESIQYWRGKASLFNLSQEQMEAAVKNRFFHKNSLDKKFLFRVLHFQLSAPKMLTDGEIELKPEVIQARKKAAEEAGKELAQSIKDFKMQVITELREGVQAAMLDLTDAIDSGHWNQKSINALKKYLDGVESMNLMDDKALQGVVNKVKDSLEHRKAKDLKKNATRREQLRNHMNNSIEIIGKLTVPEIQEQKVLEEAENEFLNVGRVVNPF